MTNNFILFLNDTKYLRQSTYYRSYCIHTHIDTDARLNFIKNKNDKKSRFIFTTDISSIGYDLIDKETYNCDIFIV